MKNKIKLFYNRNRRWIYTLEYIFYSLILLVFVTYIDTSGSNITKYIPKFLFSSVDLAKTVLSSLVSALLTISTFTFSTILTVLVLYHGSFTPRTIGDFIDKKITMKVLGIYIGGFVYCLVSLNFMKVGYEQRAVIAGTVGVIYAIICAVFFVIFIHNVLSGMSVSNLVDKIVVNTLKQIDSEVKSKRETPDFITSKKLAIKPVYSQKSGYFEMIDVGKISSILEEQELIFTVKPQIGQFIVKGTVLGYLNEDKLSKEEEDKIREQFALVDSRIDDREYHQGMRKVLEIALRALSPGINDPNTAIDCLRKLAICLAHLSVVDGDMYCNNSDEKSKIYFIASDFRHDVLEIINPILTYGKKDAKIIRSVFEMLLIIKASATPKKTSIIKEIAKDIYKSSSHELNSQIEMEIISTVYNQIVE